MKHKTAFLAMILVMGISAIGLCAEETPKPATPQTFQQAVITKAISFMPSDLKTKLSAVEKEILAAVKSATPMKTNLHAGYFLDKETGDGPSTFAEQYRIARKKVGEQATYSALAPYLGKLASTIIALSEPYHTEESAFKGDSHATFEKALDDSASGLKAEFDGNNKVDNPSEFAVNLAKRGGELLSKLKEPDASDTASVKSSVFSSAANGIADCWWTLLTAASTQAATEAAPPEGSFVGNKRSLKFHLATCKWLPAEKNRVLFKTREEAVNEGYVACKVCKP